LALAIVFGDGILFAIIALSQGAAMTPDEQQELDRLCLAVIQEKDPVKLTARVAELNAFLARRDAKLAEPTKLATQS
jgi:hypothetical protein